jgi:hypothetical protein
MSSLSHNLHDTNSRLRSWFSSTFPAAGQSASITPESMAALLSELLRAGASLRVEPAPAPGHDPDLDTELALYRSYVERLRQLLPQLHRQLVAERAQIEAQRTRVQFAAEWARASRQTL